MWGTGQQRQCHCAFSRSGGQRFAPGAVAARREGAGNIAGELRKTMTERTLGSSPSLKKRSILGGLAGHTCEATPSSRITPDVERGTRGAEGA